jgi:hypothetical protein
MTDGRWLAAKIGDPVFVQLDHETGDTTARVLQRVEID